MTKSEFLRRLEKALAPLGAQERQAALEYWEEYIAEAAAQSSEEEAIMKIDAPEDFAQRLLAEAGIAAVPRKKHSASYWVLLVMASPIWLPLGAAAVTKTSASTGAPLAGAVYELLEQKGQVTAKWYHAPLALLGVSWCMLTVFLSVRYRAANAMEIYPEEYSTVYRLCNVVPLLAAVLAALCVIF